MEPIEVVVEETVERKFQSHNLNANEGDVENIKNNLKEKALVELLHLVTDNPFQNIEERSKFINSKYNLILKQYSSQRYSINFSDHHSRNESEITYSDSKIIDSAMLQEEKELHNVLPHCQFSHYLHTTSRNLMKMEKKFGNQERVGAFKIAFKMSRLLSSNVILIEPQFYPAIYVCVAKILDKFGELVYQRLFDIANGNCIENNNHNKHSNKKINDNEYSNDDDDDDDDEDDDDSNDYNDDDSHNKDQNKKKNNYSRMSTKDTLTLEVTNDSNDITIPSQIIHKNISINNNNGQVYKKMNIFEILKKKYQRLTSNIALKKIKNEKKITKDMITKTTKKLPIKFSNLHCSFEVQTKCRNWYYKISGIREVLPHLLLEISLIRTLRFIYSNNEMFEYIKLFIHRLRGISNPLVAIYSHTFAIQQIFQVFGNVIIYNNNKNKKIFSSIENIFFEILRNVLFIFKNLSDTNFKNVDIVYNNFMCYEDYLLIFNPALEIIFDVILYTYHQKNNYNGNNDITVEDILLYFYSKIERTLLEQIDLGSFLALTSLFSIEKF